MTKHFCTCTDTKCPNNPCNHNKGCDTCIQKILELGEIPACIWNNARNDITGTSEWSMEKFSKFYLERRFEKV